MKNRTPRIAIGALLMAATSAVGIALAAHQPAGGNPLPRTAAQVSTTTTTAAPAIHPTTTTQRLVVEKLVRPRGAPHTTTTTTTTAPRRTACQGGTNGVC